MSTSFFENLLREKPDVPGWQTISPSAVQQENVASNYASFNNAKALAEQYNEFQNSQLMKQLQSTGYSTLSPQMTANLSAQLRGELTQSDLANSQRMGAARALGLGISGSQAGAAFNAYNVGKTQYAIQQAAQQQTPQWLATAAGITRAPQFDFSSVFLSPQQRFQMQMQNQEAAWNVKWLQNQVAAQPSGIAWAFAQQGDQDIEMAKQAAVSYFGGGIGMGGGGGGGWSGGSGPIGGSGGYYGGS